MGRPCGPRAPLTLTPSLPRGPALNFVDGAWHFKHADMPTGTFCRPTDAGLCVGLTRDRGCCDVNASAIVVKIHPSWHFSILSTAQGPGTPVAVNLYHCATSLFLTRPFPHLQPSQTECTRYWHPAQQPPPLSRWCAPSERDQPQTHDHCCPWQHITYAVRRCFSRWHIKVGPTRYPSRT